MSKPVFDRTFDPRYAEAVSLSPHVRRVVARNPSAFTFHGTGTYIVGRGRVAVIDPGPLDPQHLGAILSAVAEEEISAILITHTHLDHSPLAAALKEKTGAPTYGFGPHGGGSGEGVEEGADTAFLPDIRLCDGDRIADADWTMEAIHTPGHTSNHLCYAFLEEGALFTGDHVMGWSTTVVSPPDGNMRAYMASLEKLGARTEHRYYPTHGNPIENPKPFVKSLIAHRLDREAQILACVKSGKTTIAAMVPEMYRDTPVNLHPAAGRSVFAHLLHMVEDGRLLCMDASPQMRSRFKAAV